MRHRHVLSIFAVVGCLAAAAIATGGRDASAEPGRDKGMRGMRGDPVKMVERMAGELGLTADQKARLMTRAQRLKAQVAPIKAQRKAAMKDLAAQVRAGRIDAAALDRHIAQFQKTMDALRPELQAALTELHRTLTPAQREALVDKIKSRRHRRGMFGHGHRGHRGKHRRVVKMLGLSDAQQDQIEDLVHGYFWNNRTALRQQRRDMRDRMKAAAEAFVGESFDPSTLPVLGQGKAPRMIKMLRDALPTANKALAVLTPEQRAKLAAHIEKRAEQGPRPMRQRGPRTGR